MVKGAAGVGLGASGVTGVVAQGSVGVVVAVVEGGGWCKGRGRGRGQGRGRGGSRDRGRDGGDTVC